MKAWRIVLIPLIILVLVIPISACSPGGNQPTAQGQQTAVVRGDLLTKVSGNGKIAVVTDTKLSFSSGGRLITLNSKEGDKVTKGEVLAKLDTAGLEVSLAQAKVALDQAQLGQAQARVNLDQAVLAQAQAQVALDQAQLTKVQAQIALNQAQLSQIQANSSLTAAQYNLDKVQAVSNIKDAITKLQQQITTTQVNLTQAVAVKDTGSADALRQNLVVCQQQLQSQQKALATLLNGAEYSGANSLTYDIMGQTYDRLTVEDARMKELAVEAAQKVVDNSEDGIALAQKTVDKSNDGIVLAQKTLDKSNDGIALAQKTLDQSNDGIALAQKNIDYAQKQINDATITAPFDGIVATLYYKQGDTIPSPAAAPQIIIYLVDTSNLEVDVNVDEMDIPAVQMGQNAIIGVDAIPGTTIYGTVASIAIIPNVQSAAVRATAYVAKVNFTVSPGLAVKAGMNASVDIVTNEHKNVLMIPDGAIKKDNLGKSYVEIMSGQQLVHKSVVTGLSNNTWTEILSGLNDGDRVMILDPAGKWSLQSQEVNIK